MNPGIQRRDAVANTPGECDEDGIPLVAEPTEHILEDLKRFLDSDLEYSGSFAFSRAYDAPNPTLSLSDLGTFGLPLSSRDAELIKTRCIQAPFGKGERTVVDTEVRDTWEMDAKDVEFINPAWDEWMDEAVNDVCKSLGVNAAASKPRAELYKLLLYETGSHFLPHVDTEKANGMFATIVIVLPSHFTGGQAHLSHGGISKVFDSGGSSITKTTVLAWYTDVMHEIKPVTSGYRLALAYNLVHTTHTLRPVSTNVDDSLVRLRHILLSWKQHSSSNANDDEDKPQALDKVIYMLSHKYSHANLSASALKSQDAHKVAILNHVCQEIGFCLGLANIEHTVSGYGDDDGGGYYGSGSVGMGEVEEEETTVENLVSLEGEPICKRVDFDSEYETIPSFEGLFENARWDHQEYEGYQGNGAGSMARFYRRTALVLWPKWGSLGRNKGGDRRAVYALEMLKASSSLEPTSEELDLFNYVSKSAANISKSDLIKALCPNARKWGKLDEWLAVVKSCTGQKVTSLFSAKEVTAAVSAFGFPAIAPTFDMLLDEDPSNASRFEFLEHLQASASKDTEEERKHEVAAFVARRRREFLVDIRAPTWKDVGLMVNAAATITEISEILLPQLREPDDAKILDAFIGHLHSVIPKIAKSSEDLSMGQSLLTRLLTDQYERLDFLKMTTAPRKSRNAPSKSSSGWSSKMFTFIKKCVQYCNPEIGISAMDRLIDTLRQLSASEVRDGVGDDTITLVSLIIADPDLKAAIPESLIRGLGCLAIQGTLRDIEMKCEHEYLQANEIISLLDIAVRTGNAEVIRTRVLPKLRTLPWSDKGYKAITLALHRRRNATEFSEDLRFRLTNTIHEVMGTYASENDMRIARGKEEWKEDLAFCLEVGGTRGLQLVLEQIVELNSRRASQITTSLVPILEELLILAKKNGYSPASGMFASTIKKIIEVYMNKVLGPVPSTADESTLKTRLSRYKCLCCECGQVKVFLRSPAQQSLRLERVGVHKRKHVESELYNIFGSLITCSTLNHRSPQGIEVTKGLAVYAAGAWPSKQAAARELLEDIGDNILKQLYGEDGYQRLLATVEGNTSSSKRLASPAPHTPTPSNAASSSSMMIQVPRPRHPGKPLVGDASKKSQRSTLPSSKRKADDMIDLCTPSPEPKRTK